MYFRGSNRLKFSRQTSELTYSHVFYQWIHMPPLGAFLVLIFKYFAFSFSQCNFLYFLPRDLGSLNWISLRYKRLHSSSPFMVCSLLGGFLIVNCADASIMAAHMMTSSNERIFRVTGHLCGEFIGHRWIPLTKASDAELWCLLWSAPEQMVE